MSALSRAWLLDASPASRGQARLGQFYRGWLRLKSNPLALVGLAIIAALVVMAAAAPLLATQDPIAQDLAQRLQPPFSRARSSPRPSSPGRASASTSPTPSSPPTWPP